MADQPSNIDVPSGMSINKDGYAEFLAGWNDLLGPMYAAKITGASQPSWDAMINSIYGYAFSPSTLNEARMAYHVLHDYEPHSAMFPHIHFVTTGSATGVVRFGIEWTTNPGFGLGPLTDVVTTYLEFDVTDDTPLMTYVVEVDDAGVIPGELLGIDTCIALRVFRDGGHANDTYPNKVFIENVDLHYKADRLTTINKTPDFYDDPD